MGRTIPFTVIGGFLGAGKTTLLNHLLAHAEGRRIAVLMNDFASVSIDAALIQKHAGETIYLTNGCICCSLAKGFASALEKIQARSPKFDHAVIEANGIADPATVERHAAMRGFSPDGIVVVVDAEQFAAQMRYPYAGETVVRQVANADLVVANKVDLVPQEDAAGTMRWLHEATPHSTLAGAEHCEVAVEALWGARAKRSAPGGERVYPGGGHPVFQMWTLACEMPLERADLERFSQELGDGIYRAKGLVQLKENPKELFVYQQVGRRWSLEKCAETKRGGAMVAVGRAGATTLAALRRMLGTQGQRSGRRGVTATRIRFGGLDS